MTWYKATDPDARAGSQVFQLWARNCAHVRATCENGGLTKTSAGHMALNCVLETKIQPFQFLWSLRRTPHPSLYCAKVKQPSLRGLLSRPPTEKPQQCRKLLNGLLPHIRRRMHRVSDRHPKKKNNINGRGRSGHYEVLPPGARGNIMRCGQETFKYVWLMSTTY